MPSLTWKLIALLTLIFAVAVFLWMIFLGPLSRCDRLLKNYAVAVGSDIDKTLTHDTIYPIGDTNIGDQNLTNPNNYRAIRFADVLLMAAEAHNQGDGNDVLARQYLNRVRLRTTLIDVNVSGRNVSLTLEPPAL